MVGHARRYIRIDVDQAAVARLLDFGEILLEAPPGDDADGILLVYHDEDLEAELPDEGRDEERTLTVDVVERRR